MLQQECKTLGIDTDSVNSALGNLSSKPIKSHACEASAKDYAKQTSSWLKSAESIIKELQQSELHKAELGITESLSSSSVIEIIQWYQHFIAAKIVRALENDSAEDTNGSAKVALIALDRSVAAWGTLLKKLPEKEEAILQILIQLSDLRKMTEIEFPDARTFLRNGLD